MGLLYANGRGVPRDPIAAHMWFDLAVRGLPPGAVRDAAADDRDSLARDMTSEDVAEAQRRAHRWVEQFRRVPPETDGMVERE